jgi:FAD/FMN-containing dehydrogenase
MSLNSWGDYPKTVNISLDFEQETSLKQLIDEHDELIPRGNGRSYGDSALSEKIIKVRPHDLFLDFDPVNGVLHAQAGVLLEDVLDVFVSRGWFLKVTPGTKLITLGGAIACDVHGKNHHVAGCFSESVDIIRLMLPDGEIVECSKKDNIELFRATCGGMGLTGIILDAKISLKKINSIYINQITVKNNNLKETLSAFNQYKDTTYSVAWIDCLAKGQARGKSLLMLGEFCDDSNLNYSKKRTLNVPFNFPSFALNTFSIKAFNWLYYRKVSEKTSTKKVNIDSFFYPLDGVNNWNRIYGKNGFTQYQFILPEETSFGGIEKILEIIADSGKGSFLAVLKLYGPENDNYLSFPLKGYSLALDFKIEKGLFELLEQLDQIVLEHGGRIYLAKDARVTKDVFEKGYPQINEFRELRRKYNMNKKFNSFQSRRIEI